ncbi:BESS motif,MADF domain [Cinara cedri]|uniref:BESS motif,MADF domain n=1 Tax=Cinara cedri TaxID=506608 RepID=A0A5E4NMQ6_9HEMI|nr:BESS motif,MADF domain [Cinara cedri]
MTIFETVVLDILNEKEICLNASPVAKNLLKNIKEDAKIKWRNLRDTFLKEKKKVIKCRSGDSQENAEIYTGKWAYYRLMLFLKNTTMPNNTEGNISDLEDTHDSYTDNISLENKLEIEQHSLRSESDTDSFVISAFDKTEKNQSNKDFESELLKLEQQKVTALLQSNMNPVISDDEDMLFLKSLHPYFHELNPLQKLRIRNQLNTVFINELSAQVQQPQEIHTSSASCRNPYFSQNLMHYQNTRGPSNMYIQQQINPTDIENETYETITAQHLNF